MYSTEIEHIGCPWSTTKKLQEILKKKRIHNRNIWLEAKTMSTSTKT